MKIASLKLSGLFLAILLVFASQGLAIGGEQDHDHEVAMLEQESSPGWKEELKAQIIIEDAMEGRPLRLNRMHLIEKMAKEQMMHEQDEAQKVGFTAMHLHNRKCRT